MVDSGPFTLTADYFHVNVDNRLALSQNFTLAADERALLLSEGITSARTLAFFRFFINDFSTRTKGIDVVSTYTPPALGGNTIFSAALNHTETTVTQNSDLLGPGDVLALERGVPETRWNVAVNQRLGRVARYRLWPGDRIMRGSMSSASTSTARSPSIAGSLSACNSHSAPSGADSHASAGDWRIACSLSHEQHRLSPPRRA